MSSILVVTNLSASSQNALDYACGYVQGKEARIVLLRVFSFSAGFAGEGVSMTALTEVTASDESMLEAEKERILSVYPGLAIETKLVAGQFMDALQEAVAEEDARLVVMGAEGDYNDLMSWDSYVLDAFIDLPVPVMMVPPTLKFTPVKHIAFACNYKREDLYGPVQTLRRIITRTHAQLYFVHVGSGLSAEELEWKQKWQQELSDLPVTFEELAADNVVSALDEFTKSNHIDLLVIRPHRAGIWAGIFSSSNTRAIAHLNKMPVLALRGGGI